MTNLIPTYKYECKQSGFKRFQLNPSGHVQSAEVSLIGGGSDIVFKGNGFYMQRAMPEVPLAQNA